MNPGSVSAYCWNGIGSSEVEQQMGDRMFMAFPKTPEAQLSFHEGDEQEEFWTALGGKGDYSKMKELNISPDFEPRLFHVSNSSGFTFMKEIPAFAQEDLNNDDVFILDAYSSVFIWIGNRSNKFEYNGALKKAEKYIAALSDERDKDAVVIQEVQAGQEPYTFTMNFIQWEPEVAQKWLDADPIALLKAQASSNAPQEESKESSDSQF